MKESKKMTWQEFMKSEYEKNQGKKAGLFKTLVNARNLLFRVTNAPPPDITFDDLNDSPDESITLKK